MCDTDSRHTPIAASLVLATKCDLLDRRNYVFKTIYTGSRYVLIQSFQS